MCCQGPYCMVQTEIRTSFHGNYCTIATLTYNIKIKLALSIDKKRKFNLDFGRD